MQCFTFQNSLSGWLLLCNNNMQPFRIYISLFFLIITVLWTPHCLCKCATASKEQSVLSDKKWGILCRWCRHIWFIVLVLLQLRPLIVMFWKVCGFKQFVEGHYRWKWLLKQNACRIIWLKFI